METRIAMKLSDLCDKWVILRMKVRFDPALATEEEVCRKEVFRIMDGLPEAGEMILALLTLTEMNARIWEKEAAIRKEYKADLAAQGELDYEEIGRRAVTIRDYNRLRIEAKVALDRIEGRVPERKFEHASGE